MKFSKLTSILILSIILIGCFANRKQLYTHISESEYVELKEVLQTIENAYRFYQRDHEQSTPGIIELTGKQYLAIDSEVAGRFEFDLEYQANSLEKIIARSKSEFSGGKGWIIIYSTKTREFILGYRR